MSSEHESINMSIEGDAFNNIPSLEPSPTPCQNNDYDVWRARPHSKGLKSIDILIDEEEKEEEKEQDIADIEIQSLSIASPSVFQISPVPDLRTQKSRLGNYNPKETEEELEQADKNSKLADSLKPPNIN